MTICSLCVREVDTTFDSESALVVAGRMYDRKVGTLVVIDECQRPIDMFTDRELAIRVVAHGADSFMTNVGHVMTRGRRTVLQTSPIETALGAMRAAACRRLLLVNDNGKLVAHVILDDILELLAEEFGEIGKLSAEESPGSP